MDRERAREKENDANDDDVGDDDANDDVASFVVDDDIVVLIVASVADTVIENFAFVASALGASYSLGAADVDVGASPLVVAASVASTTHKTVAALKTPVFLAVAIVVSL